MGQLSGFESVKYLDDICNGSTFFSCRLYGFKNTADSNV